MKSFFLYLFLGFLVFAKAQNKISGIVIDQNNKPIVGVNILIPKIHKETITNQNGNFTLNNLPNGNFTLTFSFIGYTTQRQEFTFARSELTTTIVLQENIEHMDEVVVSTAFNKIQSQNVMKVEHQSVKSLQQKGATTLIEGLATIPGVSQISTGTSIGKPVIRGLSGNRVLVYTQGVRLENQQFGEEHGLGLNDSGIESVEIIKGPASLLYGSDALGGVLYFNPEKFAAPNTFKGDYSQKFISNTHGSSTNLGINTALDNIKFLARGKYDTNSDYKISNGDRVTNTRYNESDFKTALGYSNSLITSTVRYNFNRLNLGIPEDGIAEQSTNKTILYPKQLVNNNILSINNTIYLKKSKIDANAGYIYNDRSEFEDSEVANLRMKLKTFNYDAKYYFPTIKNLESIFGVQGMHQTNKNFGEELLIPNATTNDFGAFGTVNYSRHKDTFLAGLRFDNRKIATELNGNIGEEGYFAAVNQSYTSFNASLGYKNDAIKNLIVRLNVASGFRAPNLAELTSNGVHEGSNRYEIGNANLKSEQNVQTDVNIEYKISHLELFANGFHNTINKYIFISPTGTLINDYDVYDYLQSNARLFGGEFGIHFHPHPLDWLHITSSFENVTGKKSNGEYLPLIPANKWNSSIRTEFYNQKWLKESYANFNVEYTFAQNKNGQFETVSKDYTLLNFAFGGKINIQNVAMNLNFNINNLLNKDYISHLSRLKTVEIPNIGRTIIFGVNFSM